MIDGDKVNVVESFVNFIRTKGETVKNIPMMIMEKLEKDGIDIPNCKE